MLIRLKHLCTITAVLMFSLMFAGELLAVRPALAEGASRPSVLVVEANLGDLSQCSLKWLGDNPEIKATQNELTLSTSASPAWWKADDGTQAPSTFLLSRKDGTGAIQSGDIVWALDQIRASGAEPKTFIVAMGTTGLSVREYAEDMAAQKQSTRADIVGFALCGTPNNGYSILGKYPELTMWDAYAKAAGLTVDDLKPESSYLNKLNGGSFPNVTKSFAMYGAAGDLGFGVTDGAAVDSDIIMGSSFSDKTEAIQSPDTTISSNVNLSGQWLPFADKIRYPDRVVDTNLAQRLSSMDSYETEPSSLARVQEFYQSWFGEGAPVTHSSNVLALDLSGSMLEGIGGQKTKLEAAKEAANGYLQAMNSCSSLPFSPPMEVAIYGFNSSVSKIADGLGQDAAASVNGMSARGETNIGAALDQAIAQLSSSPTCADKRIVLLSDGASTEGKSNEAILSTTVADAAAKGIHIDTIGFGDIGESNAAFLEQLSKATDGTYREAKDIYSLKVSFLAAYYQTLGASFVDEELDADKTSLETGSADNHTSALQVGVVSEGDMPSVKLLCDGNEVDASNYTVEQNDGIATIQCINPRNGAYKIDVSGRSGKVHVFAVKQQGISLEKDIVGQKTDYSLALLIGSAILCVLAVAGAAVFTSKRKQKH